MVFMDNQTSSASYGKQVDNCPGCGRKLRLELLKSENYTARDHSR